MRLTSFTDYTLRTLLHLAADETRMVTVQDLAREHGIPRNHLTKVVFTLGRMGLVETVRGRNGGFRLRQSPEDICIGDVVRRVEADFHMAACFAAASDCSFSTRCGLQHVLRRATQAYLGELDRHTLATLTREAPQVFPLRRLRAALPDAE